MPGLVVLTTFILLTPRKTAKIREMIDVASFIEVFVDTHQQFMQRAIQRDCIKSACRSAAKVSPELMRFLRHFNSLIVVLTANN
jgi:adenylylsulfate kinase-like enzyme